MTIGYRNDFDLPESNVVIVFYFGLKGTILAGSFVDENGPYALFSSWPGHLLPYEARGFLLVAKPRKSRPS